VEYGEDRIREWSKRYGGHAAMVVLDGRTGREKLSIAIPAPADDSFAFADLTGRGRREDFVVKDRYWNMWGVASSGEVLWQAQIIANSRAPVITAQYNSAFSKGM
jgi:hypothetical protein